MNDLPERKRTCPRGLQHVRPDVPRGFSQQRLDGTPPELQDSPFLQVASGVPIHRNTRLRGCDGVSRQKCQGWRQVVGHGQYQAQHLERTQHTGGHEQKGQDLITEVQHSQGIHIDARTRRCQNSRERSEARRKHERHQRKEKSNQDSAQKCFREQWAYRLFELPQNTSTRAAALSATASNLSLRKNVSNASVCRCLDERWTHRGRWCHPVSR